MTLKYDFICLFLTFIFFGANLSAQSNKRSSLLGVVLGVGITSSYNKPVDFYTAISEADTIFFEQSPMSGPSFNFFNVWPINNSNHFIGINIGYLKIRLLSEFEVIEAFGGQFIKGENIDEVQYIKCGLNYHYKVDLNKSNRIYLNTSINLNFYTPTLDIKFIDLWFNNGGTRFKKANLGVTNTLSYSHSLTRKTELEVSMYYYTGINSHLKNRNFIPFSLGLSIGTRFLLVKKTK